MGRKTHPCAMKCGAEIACRDAEKAKLSVFGGPVCGKKSRNYESCKALQDAFIADRARELEGGSAARAGGEAAPGAAGPPPALAAPAPGNELVAAPP